MSAANDIQLRGHCQCCGRLQAVVKGRMSKHGYEVKNRGEGGWFSGVCSGNRFEPVEVKRDTLDSIVKQIGEEVLELRARAAAYEAGTDHPMTVDGRYDLATRKYPQIAWADASAYHQNEGRRLAIYRLESRADHGEKAAAQMTQIANEYHGKPLEEVRKDAGPAPVMVGDKRTLKATGQVVEALDVYRGMVHYRFERNGKTFKTSMSTRSWRMLPAPEVE